MKGLTKPRLETLHQVLSGYVERKEMPGLVALVSHHGDVHVEELGTLAFDNPAREGMIGILFTQRMMDSPEPPKAFVDFWTLAYAAME